VHTQTQTQTLSDYSSTEVENCDNFILKYKNPEKQKHKFYSDLKNDDNVRIEVYGGCRNPEILRKLNKLICDSNEMAVSLLESKMVYWSNVRVFE